MDIPLIEQVKIQAQVLVPLVKTLHAELGEERANAIVRRALGDLYRSYGERWWRWTCPGLVDTAVKGLGDTLLGRRPVSVEQPRGYQGCC
jgi:hypothetical protein